MALAEIGLSTNPHFSVDIRGNAIDSTGDGAECVKETITLIVQKGTSRSLSGQGQDMLVGISSFLL
jgi:hypothetical protein